MISLGIDIGGTGCKCVAFSQTGELLAISYREYPLLAGQKNLPPVMLCDSVFSVIRECNGRLEKPEAVRAITVSSFGESFVALDPKGEPVGDILLYFADSSSEDFSSLVSRVGKERLMQLCRVLPDASYSLSKMLYTSRSTQNGVGQFLFIASYICWCLCGESVCDVSLACRSLLFDVVRQCWSDELLGESGIRRDQLPKVVSTGSIVGKILPAIARQLNLSGDVSVVIGAHDQIVNALGSGLQLPGEAVDTSGTCECITPLFSEMPEDMHFHEDNYACVPYLAGKGYVTYAYNLSAGSVVRWLRDALGEVYREEAMRDGFTIYDVFNRYCPGQPTELMVLPFLQGMGGTPDVRPEATGSILGLTTSTRVHDIYRAVLEGITFEMRYNQERLAAADVRFDRLLACGGGARSAVWLQIKADILGCDILPVLSEETGAMGSSILGFAAVSGEDPFQIASRFTRVGQAIHPDLGHQQIYDKKYSLYKQLRTLLC